MIDYKNGNIGYIYYKEYYKSIGFDNKEKIDYINKSIIRNSDVNLLAAMNIDSPYKEKNIINSCFYLKTTYPGLIIGSGYNHSIKSVEGAFKLGLQFDYTTGLPIINGSSIKGLLRSAFFSENDTDFLVEQKINYLNNVLNQICLSDFVIDKDIFKALTFSMFEGKCEKGEKQEVKSIYNRDVFYNAVIDISKTKELMKDLKDHYILGEDYITKHGNPLKNPIPIKFIKVLPNVVWKFQFNLKDEIRNDKIFLSKENKMEIFQIILLDFGIGARTNVGYGCLRRLKQKTRKDFQEEKLGQEELEKEKKFKQDTAGMSKLQIELYEINELKDNTRNQKLMDLFKNIDQLEESTDKEELAIYMKKYLESKDKWKKSNKSKKNNKRIKKVCEILDIDEPL